MSNDIDRLTTALADRYTIERELGSGGMAIVYLAEDLKHKRKVAVKVLRPELAAVLPHPRADTTVSRRSVDVPCLRRTAPRLGVGDETNHQREDTQPGRSANA